MNEQSATAVTHAARPKRVLVVDDNPDLALMMTEVLVASGHHVRVTYDSSEAERIAAGFRPDVAVLDIGLPGMDGYELARRLRRSSGNRNLRLVAVTGFSGPDDRQRAREAGFDFHISKPPDIDEIDAVVTESQPARA